jgi:lysophospholipase L1-like esterase
MNEQARKAKINFVVLLIPTKETVFKNVVNEEKINIPKTYESLIENEESMWRKTKNFLRTHAILFIDALPTLRKNVQYGRQPYKWTSDGHPNSIGHRAIAQLVLSEIKKQHLLRGPTGLANSKATSPERQEYSTLSFRASKAH